jgi:putative transcriptional regulator
VREFVSAGLTGSLLIAHPDLRDPHFAKTVLLIAAHTPQNGAFGLVLNRPTDRKVADLLPGQDLGPLMRLPVFYGGPVETEQLTFAAFCWDPKSGRMQGFHHLGLEEAQMHLDTEDSVVRAYVGYSGWSKGQLEGELVQKSWLVGNPAPDILSENRCGLLWRETVSGFGPWFQLMAEVPEDLSRS